nr:MAG TPA: hypothetical protein [Bacteriophage sp.]
MKIRFTFIYGPKIVCSILRPFFIFSLCTGDYLDRFIGCFPSFLVFNLRLINQHINISVIYVSNGHTLISILLWNRIKLV